MLKKKKTLTSILSGFTKTIQDLKELADTNDQEIVEIDEESQRRAVQRQVLHNEGAQARSVAGKIENMLSLAS